MDRIIFLLRVSVDLETGFNRTWIGLRSQSCAREGLWWRGHKLTGFKLSIRLKSFTFAFSGLGFMLRTQHNAWLHAIASLIVLLTGFALHITISDWRWLIVAMAMVWAAETFNTAVEYICDIVSPEYSENVKRAKDIAAGAVLLCAFSAFLVGIFTLIPYIPNIGIFFRQ
ncbi:diacylglycerol kinase family protein [Asticcacaulis sp. 201]|uniref:diacylglycerol kinase family protein n=1 Tax=Asticcacaulis sp. 201 TaxID=3028787 RepID=UPI0029163980|nr:diacylglycerol kinase family protein [Asticcacaulis sp. 201]MDV6331313.1 diacylglycerol kinase family protein [Asticcacaulis sp. 201]